ncbi:MAG TPA: archease [Candidatus Krumholzibacteria bacterium]|nr:archease [Candidatus Krumholzibacteria bacterium]
MAADETAARGFREVDHSGDIGLELWGPTVADLLVNATSGLCALMTWSKVAPSCSRRIEVQAASPQDLLVDWLSAVILASSTHAELYAAADVVVSEDVVASGVVLGEPLDPARHALRFDVKAATYHDLLLEATATGYRARIIFDL